MEKQQEIKAQVFFIAKIHDCSELPRLHGNVLNFTKVQAHGINWWLQLRFHGTEENNQDQVSFYLYNDSSKPLLCSISIALLHPSDASRNIEHGGKHPRAQVQIGRRTPKRMNNFAPKAALTEYSTDNTATIHVDITIFQQNGDYPYLEPALITPFTSVQKGSKSVIEHMAALCQEGSYKDISLVVQDERLAAHKCIICPRSEVLRALSINATEVVMEDCEIGAVKEMLNFLYTGCIQGSQLKVWAAKLLALACCYQIHDLQAYVECYCLEHLADNNVLDVLQTAEQHGCHGLRNHALQFIAQHYKSLVARPGFLACLDARTCHAVLRVMAGVPSVPDLEDGEVEGESALGKRKQSPTGSAMVSEQHGGTPPSPPAASPTEVFSIFAQTPDAVEFPTANSSI